MANNEAPERIWIQPRYVNGAMPGGIYHLNPPPANTGIEVQGYVREDLATCTVEERAVINAITTYRNHMREKYHYIAIEYLFSSMDAVDGSLLTGVLETVDVLLAARAKRNT